MGQLLHGSARTTAAVRRAIQDSQASLNALAARYDINPKTVAKWRQRDFVHDAPMGPAQFLRNLIASMPYHIHTVLTDNGIQFTNRKRDRYAFEHIFARVCREHTIEHRLTKPNHPWTNGQVERMNRTLKEVTVKGYHYHSHQALKEHLYTFLNAYNFAKRLKTLHDLTPYEFMIRAWQKETERFKINPTHHIVGLNT